MAQRLPLSLKGRALAALARREYSRLELARKLQPHAESAEQLDAVLDALEAAKLLSNARFAESLAHRRAERFGVARVKQELKSHQLAPELIAAQVDQLRASEFERARAVWQKRFGEPPLDAPARARQMRFLVARGFSADVIRRVVGGDDE
jgi:regulatory protein